MKAADGESVIVYVVLATGGAGPLISAVYSDESMAKRAADVLERVAEGRLRYHVEEHRVIGL